MEIVEYLIDSYPALILGAIFTLVLKDVYILIVRKTRFKFYFTVISATVLTISLYVYDDKVRVQLIKNDSDYKYESYMSAVGDVKNIKIKVFRTVLDAIDWIKNDSC